MKRSSVGLAQFLIKFWIWISSFSSQYKFWKNVFLVLIFILSVRRPAKLDINPKWLYVSPLTKQSVSRNEIINYGMLRRMIRLEIYT